MELVEERGEMGRWERRWRGSKWPWKKMSSAGDKSSTAAEGASDEDLGGGGVAALFSWSGRREIVKEKS